jgi:hypothetical protein
MHPVIRSDCVNCLLFLDRLQRNSSFRFRAEAPPLPRFHSAPFPRPRFYTLLTGPNFGEHLRDGWQAAELLNALAMRLYRAPGHGALDIIGFDRLTDWIVDRLSSAGRDSSIFEPRRRSGIKT